MQRTTESKIMGLILSVMVLRVVLTYPVLNHTFDETAHLGRAFELWEFRVFSSDWIAPTTALSIGALPFFAGVRSHIPADESNFWARGNSVLYESGDYWRTLALARLPILVFACASVLTVYALGRRLLGSAQGLVAALVLSSDPSFVGHSGLATSEVAGTTGLLVATWLMFLYSGNPSRLRAAMLGIAGGVSVLCKYNNLLFLPPLLLIWLVLRGRMLVMHKLQCTRYRMVDLLVALLCFGVTIWLGFLLDIGPIKLSGQTLGPVLDALSTLHPALGKISSGALEQSLPTPVFFRQLGSLWLRATQSVGESAFSGQWTYFPVVLGVKLTLPMMLLVAIGSTRSLLSERHNWRISSILLILSSFIVLVPALIGRFQLGVRHMLPMFPFLALLAGSAFVGGTRFHWYSRLRVLGVLLVLWHVAESVLVHPDYIAYFNQTIRGREENYFWDSNLDWGQDLARLGRYVNEKEIAPLYLSYFGTALPEKHGLSDANPLYWHYDLLALEGWVAISAQKGQERRTCGSHAVLKPPQHYSEKCYTYRLADIKPTERIGRSIFLYHVYEGHVLPE